MLNRRDVCKVQGGMIAYDANTGAFSFIAESPATHMDDALLENAIITKMHEQEDLLRFLGHALAALRRLPAFALAVAGPTVPPAAKPQRKRTRSKAQHNKETD